MPVEREQISVACDDERGPTAKCAGEDNVIFRVSVVDRKGIDGQWLDEVSREGFDELSNFIIATTVASANVRTAQHSVHFMGDAFRGDEDKASF